MEGRDGAAISTNLNAGRKARLGGVASLAAQIENGCMLGGCSVRSRTSSTRCMFVGSRRAGVLAWWLAEASLEEADGGVLEVFEVEPWPIGGGSQRVCGCLKLGSAIDSGGESARRRERMVIWYSADGGDQHEPGRNTSGRVSRHPLQQRDVPTSPVKWLRG
ncbi:hypothetical protein ColTof3_10643 [Colletotrichum tofieldiae]|nr:hypothetical protein ColTof3_10643 [Colletotrichum tofieldiae]